jgi:CSLREA domain-containing protein
MRRQAIDQDRIRRARRLPGASTILATAAVICVLLNTIAQAETIVVNSLADPGAPSACALRDAITAANSKKAVNGCVAGRGDDQIRFLVTGKIQLKTTMPPITNRGRRHPASRLMVPTRCGLCG